MIQASYNRVVLLLGLSAVVLSLIDLSLGSVPLGLTDIIGSLADPQHKSGSIIWYFRLPKTITCIVAGSALSVSGLLMQTLFRNPLAGPDVLGLSSGANLAVAIFIMAGGIFSFRFIDTDSLSTALAASIGSGLIFLLVMSLSRFVKEHASLLVIGLMIAAAASSLLTVIQYISPAEDLQAFVIWTMGTVGNTNWRDIVVLTVAQIVGITMSYIMIKSLNAWLLGDLYAASIGVNTKATRITIVSATSLLTGAVTAFCGPIAFVGLAVPHLIRLVLSTTDHRVLIPAVALGGSCLLLFCDIIANIPGQTQVLPINALTSFIGAPVVIALIIKNKRLRL